MRIENRRATEAFRKVPCLLSALLLFVLLSHAEKSNAQTSYFPPPVAGSTWETTDPAELGWCNSRIDSLYNFLDTNGTKAFILLYHGRILLEHYSGTFTQDSLWYWASAGKTLTSTIVGLAQEDGYLDINDPTQLYLGLGLDGRNPGTGSRYYGTSPTQYDNRLGRWRRGCVLHGPRVPFLPRRPRRTLGLPQCAVHLIARCGG
jgi:hypothetical protein